MISFDGFCLASPKFTDSEWVIGMLQSIGMFGIGTSSDMVFQKDVKTIKVSLVKHPRRWLACCYRAIMSNRVSDFYPWTELPMQSFEAFIRCYIKEFPGSYSKLYERYEAETIMRVEDMPLALVDFLVALGVDPLVMHKLKEAPLPVVPSVTISRDLSHKLVLADKEFCETYDYY